MTNFEKVKLFMLTYGQEKLKLNLSLVMTRQINLELI